MDDHEALRFEIELLSRRMEAAIARGLDSENLLVQVCADMIRERRERLEALEVAPTE